MNIRYASLLLAFCISIIQLSAQTDALEVIRSTALPWGSPVQNIFVDADNTKWVANTRTVKKVLGPRTAVPIALDPGQQALFQYPGGNADIRWTAEALKAAVGDIIDEDNYITAAFYDEINGDIWLGTTLTGAFQLKKQNGQLQFIAQWSMDNTRLRSNFVNDIKRGPKGRMWIATDDGVLVGKNGNWDIIERGLIVEAIAIGGSEVWLMGDGLVGKVDRRDKWDLIDIPAGKVEREIVDIAVDGKGRLWLASAVISCYDPEQDTYQVFGGAEEYTSEFANRLVVDMDGAVWIGTEDKGVYVIQKGSSLIAAVEVEQAVSCGGNGKDGALLAQVSGGTPPYQYTWSNGANGERLAKLSPGEYQLTITDSKGKSRSVAAQVPDERLSVTTNLISGVSAEGLTDGQAEVRVKGGERPYTFSWDNGEKRAIATQLSAGLHLVTVTDSKGCEQAGQVEVPDKRAPLAASIEEINPIQCQGNKSAALRAQASGGESPYQYKWSFGGAASAQITGLPSGNYAVTITDAEGNTAQADYLIEEPAALSVRTEVIAMPSLGEEDGRAVVEVSGGKPPYKYRWDNGETLDEATQLGAGLHKVVVTDANSCETTATVEMTEDIAPMSVSIQQSSPISCVDAQDGSLAAEVEGGKPPYVYKWSHNALNSSRATEIGAGKYELVVTDAAGNNAKASFALEGPEKLTASAKVISPASTGNADGVAKVAASGGTGDYSYKWTNGETTAQAEQLAPKMHTVVVTDEAGCTAAVTIEIKEDILPLQVALEATQSIDCADGATGAISAQISGGKWPYEYAWSADGQSGGEAQGLAAGSYGLTVSDAAGNSAEASLELSEPSALQVQAQAVSPASTNSSDGVAKASASGGTAPYAYAWDTGADSGQAEGLAPGTHSVTVTDQNGCTATAQVEVSENILPLQVALEATQSIDCADGATGAISAQVSGGKGPFEYAWSAGGQSSGEAQGLAAGSYGLTVSDAAGNSAEASLELSEPSALQVQAQAVSPASTNSSDGVAKASASGGTAPYAYAWDTGADSGQAEGLAPGTHSVTVTDQNGCTATAQVEVSENILPLQVALEATQSIDCADGATGAISAQVSGGKGPFEYAWSAGGQSSGEAQGLAAGSYGLTVSDAAGNSAEASLELSEPSALQVQAQAVSPASTNSSDGVAKASASGGTAPYAYAWDTGADSGQAEGLAPGTHSVTVTDQNGCTATAQVEVSENILPLQVALEATESIDCAGGTTGAIAAQVSGGKGPYEYAWSADGQSSGEAQGLAAGSYGLTVSDAAGNSAEASLELSEPSALQVQAQAVSPASTNSSDGVAKASASGGTAPYAYAWDTGADSGQAEGLAPGTHSVTVTDQNGCTATAQVEVSENILPLELTLQLSQPISCAGQSDAVVQATVSGGKPPFTYQWNDTALSGETADGLAAGDYALTVTDVAGTTQSAAVSVEAPAPLTLNFERVEPAFSDRSEDGKAVANAKGGTPPYTYEWSNGVNSSTADGLDLGSYSLTVTDANGCTVSGEAEIKERVIKELTRALSSGQTIQMQKVQFEADSTNIQESVEPILDEVYLFLQDNPSAVVEIGGHTNNLPPAVYCDSLSTARARAVADYLIAKGIPSKQVYYKGYGKRDPLFSNKTEYGRRRNQRVEIKIIRL